jgi:NADP-dependent 3-hydroxy acid dehydrogenase YdfG
MMIDINEEGVRNEAARIAASSDNSSVWWRCLNVTDGEGWSRAVEACVGLGKRLDVCVNNAGTTYKNKVSRYGVPSTY